MTIRLITTILTALLFLSGCNLIYKQNVQQGNALEQEDLDELYIGMNRRQVLFVLGTPSVRDPFNQDRWDYIQTFSRRGEDMIQRTVTLEFENDALAQIIGLDDAIQETASFVIDEDEEDSEEELGVIEPDEKDQMEEFEKAQDVLDQGTQDDF